MRAKDVRDLGQRIAAHAVVSEIEDAYALLAVTR